MHATGVKHVLQAGVFDEADGASMSSGKAGGPIRATVCLFGTFVSDFRIDFRFRRYKSTLVSGFDFRIGLSFTKVRKNTFVSRFQNNELRGTRYESRVGTESQVPTKNHIRLSYGLSYPTFVQRIQPNNNCIPRVKYAGHTVVTLTTELSLSDPLGWNFRRMRRREVAVVRAKAGLRGPRPRLALR